MRDSSTICGWGGRVEGTGNPELGLAAVEGVIARYYDPATAQFLTVDPMVATTLSPYGYVAGDPVNAGDPSGLTPADPNGPGLTVQQILSDPCGYSLVAPNCTTGLGAIAGQFAEAGQTIASFPGGVVNFFGTEAQSAFCNVGAFCGVLGSASVPPPSGQGATVPSYLENPNGSPFFNRQVDSCLAAIAGGASGGGLAKDAVGSAFGISMTNCIRIAHQWAATGEMPTGASTTAFVSSCEDSRIQGGI